MMECLRHVKRELSFIFYFLAVQCMLSTYISHPHQNNSFLRSFDILIVFPPDAILIITPRSSCHPELATDHRHILRNYTRQNRVGPALSLALCFSLVHCSVANLARRSGRSPQIPRFYDLSHVIAGEMSLSLPWIVFIFATNFHSASSDLVKGGEEINSCNEICYNSVLSSASSYNWNVSRQEKYRGKIYRLIHNRAEIWYRPNYLFFFIFLFFLYFLVHFFSPLKKCNKVIIFNHVKSNLDSYYLRICFCSWCNKWY